MIVSGTLSWSDEELPSMEFITLCGESAAESMFVDGAQCQLSGFGSNATGMLKVDSTKLLSQVLLVTKLFLCLSCVEKMV